MLTQLLDRRYFRWLLAILSGGLMVLAFPFTGGVFPLVFVAWVPLLLLESHYVKGKRSWPLLLQCYAAFFIYNTGTTWWIYNADEDGAYMAFFCNTLLMALAFFLFHRIKRSMGPHWTTSILLCTWIAFEFLHFNWELSWPWLTLGNVFANAPSLVQWYAWTGVLGGTLWVLWLNVLVYRLVRSRFIEGNSWKANRILISRGVLLLCVPMLVSVSIYYTYSEEKKPYEVVVIQPNMDPYHEKFVLTSEQQLNNILALADKTVSAKTQLVVAPETALNPTSPDIVENELHQLVLYHYLMERRANWSNASFLIGAGTQKYFERKNSAASRPDPDGPGFVEHYNSSVLFNEKRTPQIVHKSKLVLGVEKIPFTGIFPALEDMSIQLGGSSGSLGIEDKGPSTLTARGVSFAPVVCYESIYGDFVRRQCRQDASFIAVITNDGWWKDTPGYKQHFAFARLRAIENRRYVVRSANTGKSGIINQRGDILRETGWWKELAFRETIQLSERKTLYQMLGDYLGYFAVVGFALFAGWLFWKSFRFGKAG